MDWHDIWQSFKRGAAQKMTIGIKAIYINFLSVKGKGKKYLKHARWMIANTIKKKKGL